MDAGRTAFEHLILRRLPKQRDYDLLDKGVRQELLDDFMPEIRQLEDLLGRDLAIWYAPEPLGRAEPEPAANPVAHMQPTGSVHVPVQVPTDSAAQTGTGA